MNLLRFFSPIFFLEADGELSRDLIPYIKSFEFKDEHKKPDEVRIVFINDSFRWIDDQRFATGVEYRVRWGYPTLWSDTLKVKVQKVIPTFPKDAVPTLTMISWDTRIDMSYQSSARNYGPVSSSEVARVLAKQWGLKTDIEESNDGRKEDRVQTTRYTDLAYLIKLADSINFRFDIVGDTLLFKKHGYDQAPEFLYTYFTDREGVVLSFTPEIKEKALKKKLRAAAADTGKPYTPPPDAPISQPELLVSIDPSLGKFTKVIKKAPSGSTAETSQKVADQHSAADQKKIDLNADKATLVIVGDPRVRKGKVIRIEGVGRFYSGDWYVSSTTHKISSDSFYTTEIKVQRGALDGDKKKINDKKDGKDVPPPPPAQSGVKVGTSGGKMMSEYNWSAMPEPILYAPAPKMKGEILRWQATVTSTLGSTRVSFEPPTTQSAEAVSAASALRSWGPRTRSSSGSGGRSPVCPMSVA